jgi:hypothetical protein
MWREDRWSGIPVVRWRSSEGRDRVSAHEATPYLHAVFLKRLLYYLDPRTLFGKSDPNVNLRFMHGINRISFFMFLICLVILFVKFCTGQGR